MCVYIIHVIQLATSFTYSGNVPYSPASSAREIWTSHGECEWECTIFQGENQLRRPRRSGRGKPFPANPEPCTPRTSATSSAGRLGACYRANTPATSLREPSRIRSTKRFSGRRTWELRREAAGCCRCSGFRGIERGEEGFTAIYLDRTMIGGRGRGRSRIRSRSRSRTPRRC